MLKCRYLIKILKILLENMMLKVVQNFFEISCVYSKFRNGTGDLKKFSIFYTFFKVSYQVYEKYLLNKICTAWR